MGGSNGRRTYDAAHRAERKRLLRELDRHPGQPCARCGLPMRRSQALHLDHDDYSDRWLGPSHATRNTRAGQALTMLILRAPRLAAATPLPARHRA
jgi:hypothetical protein